MVSTADEHRHDVPSPPVPEWEEAWYFDFATDDGSLGMAVRLTLRPGENKAWYWAHLAGPGRPLVAVRDHDVEIPRGRSLEVRASGLWADFVCETPMDHWTLGLEAFGVAFDDPAEALGEERGDRTALGLDMEWEAAGPPEASDSGADPGPPLQGGRYDQACVVHGELLAGRERIEIAARGHRYHAWGPVDWGHGEWLWAAGVLDGGGPFSHRRSESAAPAGDSGLLTDLDLDAGPNHPALRMAPLAQAPVLVPVTGGEPARLARALCRFDAGDGRRGYGWAERVSGRTAGRP